MAILSAKKRIFKRTNLINFLSKAKAFTVVKFFVFGILKGLILWFF